VEGDIASKALAIAERAVFIGRSIMGEETPQGEESTQAKETAQPAAQIATAASTSRPSAS
jgi:cytoskeletal protein CcmA (bactofilin family)